MRTLILANNRVGLEGIEALREAGASLGGLVVHRPERARYRVYLRLDLEPEPETGERREP